MDDVDCGITNEEEEKDEEGGRKCGQILDTNLARVKKQIIGNSSS